MIEVVATGSPPQRWVAKDRAGTAGQAIGWIRPDQRCFLLFEDCQPAAYQPLVAAAAATLNRDLYVELDADDHGTRAQLQAAGLVVARQEHRYLIPTDLSRLSLSKVGVPPGFELISAADADAERLMALDEALRDDVPGASGWRWQLDAFLEQTSGPDFDPATYLVAVRQPSGAYVGLVRVWLNPNGPRLGLIGALPPFRRTRLTVALGAAAFRVLHERGLAEVAAEVDATNRGANLGLRKLGARRVGSAVELVLKRPH